MTTLDDRLLGEKTHYYCSSDEEGEVERARDGDENCASEEEDSGEGASSVRGASSGGTSSSTFEPDPNSVNPNLSMKMRSGITANTGPKGVIKDWQRFKQLETQKREEEAAERLQLISKLSLAPEKSPEDKKNKKGKKKSKKSPDEEDIDNLLEQDDVFFEAYMKQRMTEMVTRYESLPMFGQLLDLDSGPAFLKAVDEENKHVTVFVHLYDPSTKACETLNGCLVCLSADYARGFKFCKLDVRVVNMTEMFQSQGVPALLIYRGGNLVGNFVRLGDEFPSDEFFAQDVAKFLIEHGYLPDPSLIPKIVISSPAAIVAATSVSRRVGGRREDEDYDDY